MKSKLVQSFRLRSARERRSRSSEVGAAFVMRAVIVAKRRWREIGVGSHFAFKS